MFYSKSEENDQLVKEFSSITAEEGATAEAYLSRAKMNLQDALDSYFHDKEFRRPVLCHSNISEKSEHGRADEELAASLQESEKEAHERLQKNQYLQLLTWNIDGLNDCDTLKLRTLAVCETINTKQPDVVFLQEVVDASLVLLKIQCKGYEIIWHKQAEYFCCMLLKKDSVHLLSSKKIITFPNSKMGRYLLCLDVTMKAIPLLLITSHLESTASCASERKSQLGQTLEFITQQCKEQTVFFGGDLNIRDKEICQLGGLPDTVSDVWEMMGSPDDAKYTWDMSKNDNLQINSNCRLRFDRIFVKNSTSGKVDGKSFKFVGCNRLQSCQKFPSDHFGILFEFDLVPGS